MRFTISPPKPWLIPAAIISSAVAITFFHLWHITNLPRGLYVDESSIGYNAALIAQTLHDEHGVRLPIYFRAFGEYKHPLFIYTTALLNRVFGTHEFLLRFTSFLFFAAFLIVITVFVQQLYQTTAITLFTLLAAGFLPWFFPMSRIAFEVISQAPITAGSLFCIYVAFHGTRRQSEYAIAAGALIGLSLYTYSSCKLLAPLQVFGILLLYFRPTHIKKTLLVIATSALVALPTLQFTVTHPGAFATRFRTVTYLYDSSKTSGEKVTEFITNYARQLSPAFLIWSGDTNLRHAVGYGGELFGIVAILAATGLGYVLFSRHPLRHYRFYYFLLFNVLIAPIPPALTTGNTGHSLRTVLLGIVLLLFASYGLYQLSQCMRTQTKQIFIGTTFVLLLLETGLYLQHYFITYPTTTSTWFESYNFRRAVNEAIAQHPEHIIVSSEGNASYIQAQFYGQALRGLSAHDISVAPPVATPNTCLIYFSWNKVTNPDGLTPSFALINPGAPTQLQCFMKL